MERAVARIDLGAVRAQLRAAEGRAGRGRRALRGGQGRRLRPRRRRPAPRRRWPAARPGWRWRPAAEAAQIGRRFPHVPLLTMGALTDEELDAALAAGSEVAVWREGFRGLVAARARAQGRPARVHVKHDSGMGRLGNRDPERGAGPGPRLRRGSRPRAGRRLDPLRHRRRTGRPSFFDEQLDRFDAGRRRGPGRVPRRSPSTPPTAPPSSATAAPTSTWPAAGSPSTGSTPSRATRPSAASRRRSRCAPTSPT